jgi:hypothetical protein
MDGAVRYRTITPHHFLRPTTRCPITFGPQNGAVGTKGDRASSCMGALVGFRRQAYPVHAKAHPPSVRGEVYDHPASARTRAVPARARAGSHIARSHPARPSRAAGSESIPHSRAAGPVAGAGPGSCTAPPGPHQELGNAPLEGPSTHSGGPLSHVRRCPKIFQNSLPDRLQISCSSAKKSISANIDRLVRKVLDRLLRGGKPC